MTRSGEPSPTSPRNSIRRENAFSGACTNGELPAEALHHYSRAPAFTTVREDAASPASTGDFGVAGLMGMETRLGRLGMWAVSWILPAQLTFSRVVIEPRVSWMLDAYPTKLRRLKAVFRTGRGPSWFIQSHGRGLTAEDSAYRRDSRLEIVLDMQPTEEFLDAWRNILRDAALPPRGGSSAPAGPLGAIRR